MSTDPALARLPPAAVRLGAVQFRLVLIVARVPTPTRPPGEEMGSLKRHDRPGSQAQPSQAYNEASPKRETPPRGVRQTNGYEPDGPRGCWQSPAKLATFLGWVPALLLGRVRAEATRVLLWNNVAW
jgi:hypothetical protein